MEGGRGSKHLGSQFGSPFGEHSPLLNIIRRTENESISTTSTVFNQLKQTVIDIFVWVSPAWRCHNLSASHLEIKTHPPARAYLRDRLVFCEPSVSVRDNSSGRALEAGRENRLAGRCLLVKTLGREQTFGTLLQQHLLDYSIRDVTERIIDRSAAVN